MVGKDEQNPRGSPDETPGEPCDVEQGGIRLTPSPLPVSPSAGLREHLIRNAEHQARVHGLDPDDQRLQGMIRNLLQLVFAEWGFDRRELFALRKLHAEIKRSRRRKSVAMQEALEELDKLYALRESIEL